MSDFYTDMRDNFTNPYWRLWEHHTTDCRDRIKHILKDDHLNRLIDWVLTDQGYEKNPNLGTTYMGTLESSHPYGQKYVGHFEDVNQMDGLSVAKLNNDLIEITCFAGMSANIHLSPEAAVKLRDFLEMLLETYDR